MEAQNQTLLTLSARELAQHVNEAFKNYTSLLALSLSPLAVSTLILPALVLDSRTPTPDERGRALRLVLRWAVERLAPAAPHYPLSATRPFDDPSWRDPLWWRYNLLRHRYLEPLSADELEDLNASSLTEALLALTGIPTPDTFFAERERAIQEVALFLREQLTQHCYDADLRLLAVTEALAPLKVQPTAQTLLELAATFRDIFPRALLLEIATQERVTGAGVTLEHLLLQRILQAGDGGLNLWLPPALREHLYANQDPARVQSRHRAIARYYQDHAQPLEAAWHWQCSQHEIAAAQLLLPLAPQLLLDTPDTLLELLERFTRLPPDLECAVQLLCCDLLRRAGQREAAVAAAQRALPCATVPLQQARCYYRLGKLHEDHNQRRALHYYQRANALFPPQDPERVNLLKDQGWLHIKRREWELAEVTLHTGLATLDPSMCQQQADLHDALASLYKYQAQYDQALHYAHLALATLEELGDLTRAADVWNNIGLIYERMGEWDDALAAYQDALNLYRKLNNQEAIATAILNQGVALYSAGRLPESLARYRESWLHFKELDLPRPLAKSCYNLAEVLADLGQAEESARYWQEGYSLSEAHALEDQLQFYQELREGLQQHLGVKIDLPVTPEHHESIRTHDWDAQKALDIAQQEGRVTARRLMEVTGISRATATRKLGQLLEGGYLIRHGEKRGVYYTYPTT